MKNPATQNSDRQNQNPCSRRSAIAKRQGMLLAIAWCLAGPSAHAQGVNPTPGVLPPNSTAFGKSYGQWAEAWFQWSFSMSLDHHPLFDTAPVNTGQSGHLWYIGGNYTGTPVTRDVTIPAGTALFFPILAFQADNTDCSGGQMISDGFSEAHLRDLVKSIMDLAHDLSCTIDGVAVGGLADPINTPYRVQTASPGGFSYVVPATDNLLDFEGLPCWTDNTGDPITVSAATYHPVADGEFILVAPLSVGQHVIHASGTIGNPPLFTEDFTYNVTVK